MSTEAHLKDSVMRTGVYKIENQENGKAYIGSSAQIEKRWWRHRQMLRDRCHPNAHLQAAWNLYGKDAFVFSVAEEVESDALVSTEQKYLDEYLATGNCYNMATIAGPGSRGRPVSQETRRKLSEASKGERSPMWGKKHTEETRQKMRGRLVSEENRRKISRRMMGNKHALGHKVSEEARRKMGEPNTGNQNALGYKHSAETRRKMSEDRKGRKPSEETRGKLSRALTGNKNAVGSKGWLGRKHTEETKRKISIAQKQRLARKKRELGNPS